MVAFRCEDLLLSGVWSFAELYCVEKTSAAPSPELYCVQTFCATTYSPSSSKPEFVSQAPPSQNLFPEGDEEPDMPVRVLMSAVPEWCESIEHCTERTYRRRAQALSSGFRSLVAVPISSSTTLPPSLTCNFPCPPDTGADPSWSSGVVVLYSETEVPYSEEALFSILNTLAGSGGKLTPENRPTVLQHPAASSPPAVNTLSSHSDQPEARSPIDVTTPTDRASNGQPSPEAPDSTNCPIPADQRVQISVNDSPSSRLVADGILSPKSSSSSTSPRTARAHISTEQTRPPSYPRHSLPTFFQQHSSSQMVSGALSPSPSISSASSSSLPLPADSHHTNIQSVSPGFQNSPVTIMHSSSSAPTSSSSSEHAAAARGLPVMESSETHHSSPSSSSSRPSPRTIMHRPAPERTSAPTGDTNSRGSMRLDTPDSFAPSSSSQIDSSPTPLPNGMYPSGLATSSGSGMTYRYSMDATVQPPAYPALMAPETQGARSYDMADGNGSMRMMSQPTSAMADSSGRHPWPPSAPSVWPPPSSRDWDQSRNSWYAWRMPQGSDIPMAPSDAQYQYHTQDGSAPSPVYMSPSADPSTLLQPPSQGRSSSAAHGPPGLTSHRPSMHGEQEGLDEDDRKSSVKSPDKPRRSAAGLQVTYEMVQQHFNKPLQEACKALGISSTAFKHHCRRLGIVKWPFKRPGKLEEISIEAVHALSDRTAREAAKALGVSLNTVKKACRRFGIERWPRTAPTSINSKDDASRLAEAMRGEVASHEYGTVSSGIADDDRALPPAKRQKVSKAKRPILPAETLSFWPIPPPNLYPAESL